MSTQRIIQRLVAGEDYNHSNRREVETFFAGAALTAGNWVMFDTSKTDQDRCLYVINAAGSANTGCPLVVGVALDTATAAGQKVRVVTAGYVEGAAVADAVTAGQALFVDNAAAGRAVAYAATALCGHCGVALEDGATANTADVWVVKSF